MTNLQEEWKASLDGLLTIEKTHKGLLKSI